MSETRRACRSIAASNAYDSDVCLGEVSWSPAKTLWLGSMAAVAIVGGIATLSWAGLLVFALATGTVLLLGHSLGSHRKLIHDSFDCPTWLAYLLVYLGVQVGLSGPIGLLLQHDLRDYAQRQADCHPYLRHGRSFLADGWWQLFCELKLDKPPRIDPPAAIVQNRFYRFLERTWMLQQLPPAALLYLLGGWTFVIWGVCARITAGVTGHWLIGYFAHNRGGMHHAIDDAAVQGRNIRWTSLLTMGESWHNNHHAFPSSARLGLYAGEWDPGWWMLVCLRKVGLVTRTTLPCDLPPRPGMRALDACIEADAVPLPTNAGWTATWRAAGSILFAKPSLVLRTPGVTLDPAVLTRWCGPRVACAGGHRHRLELAVDDTIVRGLPGVLLGIAARGATTAALALMLLPPAIAMEWLRGSLGAVEAR